MHPPSKLVLRDRGVPGGEFLVEFLNDQMERTNVIGLEVKKFVSDGGLRTLVPRVAGQSARSRAAKGVLLSKSYLELLASASRETQEVERKLLLWSARNGFRDWFPKASVRQFDTENRVRLLLLHPKNNEVEFRFSTIGKVGMEEEGREVPSQLARLAGGHINNTKTPRIGCAALLRSSDEFENRLPLLSCRPAEGLRSRAPRSGGVTTTAGTATVPTRGMCRPAQPTISQRLAEPRDFLEDSCRGQALRR